MTEEELRGYVREAIARHRGREAPSTPEPAAVRLDPSHALLPISRGSEDDDGACVIEPAVRCNHCGYCISYGH